MTPAAGSRRARLVTMTRIAALAAAAAALVAVQMGGLGHLRLFGVYPDLLVVVVTGIALQRGPMAGVLAGFIFGFVADLPGGHLVGLSAVGYAAAALAAGLIGVRAFPERWIVMASAVAVGTVVSQLVHVLGANAFGFRLAFWEAGLRIVGGMVLYHWLLTPPTFSLTSSLMDMILPRGPDA